MIGSEKFQDTYRHKGLRKKLVDFLRSKGIIDEAVLEAINQVPRHIFLDKAFLELAYEDRAMPIGEGQTISQPYTVAFQSQLLEIKKRDKVLEIGTGSGYQACVLEKLGAKVYSIERQRKLYEKTRKLLGEMQSKVSTHFGDGTLGLPAFAPFDKIIVTAGAPVVPQSLSEQLKPGGLLVIPVGDELHQRMLRIRKTATGELETESFENFKFVPLLGKEGW
ncbi:MAG: protein-L-isoaspartate(D-aspartate) O-methyltransferase [Bacteroidia bacterium]